MPVVKEQLLSQTVYDTDGVTTQWEFNFSGGYVSTDHVKAYVLRDGVRTDIPVTADMLIGQYLLQITPALADGGELTVYRDTPRTLPLVNFQDRGAINEASLDTNAKQAVFVSAEVADFVNRTDLAGATEAAEAAAISAAAAASAAAIAGPAATAAADSAAAAAASAATIDPSNFATAAQGAKADTAMQPADLTAANITDATTIGRVLLTAADQEAARTAIGAQAAGSYAATGANADITSLGGLTSAIAETRQINPIWASVDFSALFVSASELALEFRSTTLSDGSVSFVKGVPSILMVPNTATLGSVSNKQSDIVVLALNNAGTIELAVVNLAGGVNLDETGLISTTAISEAATSASTVYSTTAHTAVAYRVIGLVRSTQTTAGTWESAPSLIQGQGGQALAALSAIGYGQTWQDLTGSRAGSTTYYNTTGRPISVYARNNASNANGITLTINGVVADGENHSGLSTQSSCSGIVPPGGSYSVTYNGASLGYWAELR